jgi:hypothetical protein
MSAPPILSSATPADNTSAVAVGNNIVLTFNENVFFGTGNLVVSDGFTQSFLSNTGTMQTRWIGATDMRSVAASDSQITISGNVVTINLANDLKAGLNYGVYIPRGFLVDANNVPFAGLLDSSKLNFTTAGGVAAPTAHIGATIGFEDTGVSPSDYITNSAAQTVHGTYTGTLGANDSVQVSVDNGLTWHAANATAGAWTCSSFDALTTSSTLVARVVNTQGISSGSVSHSYVYDNTPPVVSNVVISDQQLTAGETATVTITFSEAVANLSIAHQTVTSSSYGAFSSADGGLTWTATVTPNANTQASNVQDGFQFTATDLAGNALATANAGDTAFVPAYNVNTVVTVGAITALSADTGSGANDFVTKTAAQTISGTVIGAVPGGSFVQVSLDGGGTWNNATVNNTTHTWSYATTLQTGTHSIEARTFDGSNGTSPVEQSYTLDTTAPTVSMSNITPTLFDHAGTTINFSTPELQVITSGKSGFVAGDQIQIVDTNHGNAIVGSYTLQASDLDGSNTTFDTKRIDNVSSLADGVHNLVVQIGDLAGNTPATAGSTPLVLTVDTTAPTYTVTTPAALGNADIDTSIVLTFSEDVNVSSDASFTLSDNSDTQLLSVETGEVSANGNVVTFTLHHVLDTSANYTLHMDGGNITDEAGNVGVDSNTDVASFSTNANTVPGAPQIAITDSASATDPGGETTDGVTNNDVVTVSSLTGGSVTWEYSEDHGQTWQDGIGTSFLLSENSYSAGDIQVRQVNASGHHGNAASNSGSLTVDTTAPDAVIVADETTPYNTSGSPQTVQGQYAYGDNSDVIVEVSFNGGSSWTRATLGTPDNGSNTWSANGVASQPIVVRITDSAGNISKFDTPNQTHNQANFVIGSAAGDSFVNDSSHKIMYGEGGDDLFTFTSLVVNYISGGDGSDTIALDMTGTTMNLNSYIEDKIVGIDVIDLGTSAGNTLTIPDSGRLDTFTDNNSGNYTLTILGDNTDTVNLTGSGFKLVNTDSQYHYYDNTFGPVHEHLVIAIGVQVSGATI